MYLSEVAPVTWRGALNISFQMSTTVGILLANCINYGGGPSEGTTKVFPQLMQSPALL